MRTRIGLFAFASLVAASAGAMPAGAAAQQPQPAKPGVAIPPHEPSPADDLFQPPMRGTPGGRISGGTRGIPRPGTPGTPPAPSPGSPGVKSLQAPLIPVAQ